MKKNKCYYYINDKFYDLKTEFHLKIGNEDKKNLVILRKIVNKLERNDSPEYERVGVEVLGFLLYGFVTWIKKIVEIKDVEKLLFLSREGHIIKQAYDVIYDNNVGCTLGSEYINVSRISLCRAYAKTAKNYDELVQIFSSLMRGVNTVYDFLKVIGIQDLFVFDDSGISPTDKISQINKHHLFNQIQRYGKEYFNAQNRLAKEYIRQSACGAERVAVIDIGWAGTMQMMMTKICPYIDFIGLYIGVSNVFDSVDYCSMDRTGFICDDGEWDTKGQLIRFAQTAMETLFLHTEGTTVGYARKNERIVPLKYEDNEKNKLVYNTQEAAIKFLRLCKQEMEKGNLRPVSPDLSMMPFINFAVYPHKNTIEYFKDMIFTDGISASSFLPNHDLLFYLTNIAELKNELESNNSKIIWLYALLRLHLPYFYFLRFLTSRIGMKSKYGANYQKQ